MDNTELPKRSGVCVNQRIVETKHPLLAVLISLAIMGLFLLLQFICSAPYYFVKMVDAMAENDMDSALAFNAYVTNITSSNSSVFITFLVTFISAVVAALCYRFIFCKKLKLSQVKATCRQVFAPRRLGGFFLAAVSTYFISNILCSVILSLSESLAESYDMLISLSISDINTIPMFLALCVLAPLNEECIMRGMVLTKLKSNMSKTAAIILCGILFGVLHMNLVQGIYVIPCGMMLAYAALKYNSIIPSMLIHGIYNGLNYIMQFVPEDFGGSFIISILAIIIAGAGWYLLEGRLKPEDKASDSQTDNALDTYEMNSSADSSALK